MECAHIIRRWRAAVRTDERNAWALCAGCHRTVDNDARAFALLVEATIGWELHDELKRRADSNPRPWKKSDWEAETARLRALVELLDVA